MTTNDSAASGTAAAATASPARRMVARAAARGAAPSPRANRGYATHSTASEG